jgi:hypothetical protein
MQHVKDGFAYEGISGSDLLVGEDLVQSCMILALTAVLRRSIAHDSINVEFIKGLVQYKF